MPQHVIKRLTFRLHFPARDQAVQLEHEIIDIYRYRIEQLLDECFSGLAGADTECRFERLELDLGDIRPENLAAEIPKRVSRQLVKIAGNSHNYTAETVATQERQFTLFRYFLETGTLPWWAEKFDKQALEQLLEQLCVNYPAELKALMPDVLRDGGTARRLVNQFSDKCLSHIGRLYLPENKVSLAVLWLRDAEALFAELKRLENERSISPHARLPAGGPVSGGMRRSIEHASPVPPDNLDRNYGIGVSGRLPEFDTIADAAKLREHYWRNILSGLAHGMPGGFNPATALQETIVSITGGNYGATRRLLAVLVEAAGLPAQRHHKFSTPLPDLINKLRAGLAAAGVDSGTESDLTSGARAKKPETGEDAANTRTPVRDPFTDADEDFIHNAGLVIFWPYLPRFFTNLGLADGNSFIDDLAAQRAVFLLQNLVAPDPETPESLLSMNKLLCGLDLQRSLPAGFTPTESEQDECAALFAALKLHWNVLAGMSAERIRTDFLQREGILRPCSGNWQLQVENRVQDILVQRLPWPIGVVKLPWMDYAILVHWG